MRNLREIEHTVYELWYAGKDKNQNGVGLIIDKNLKHEFFEVKRMGD